MSCDWLSDGQKLVTASWDHTAKLWDFKTAQVILCLEGIIQCDLCKGLTIITIEDTMLKVSIIEDQISCPKLHFKPLKRGTSQQRTGLLYYNQMIDVALVSFSWKNGCIGLAQYIIPRGNIGSSCAERAWGEYPYR